MIVIAKATWIHLGPGQDLSTRSNGEAVYYLPGGKREPGETDMKTLACEIREELTDRIDPAAVHHLGAPRSKPMATMIVVVVVVLAVGH
ncbi:NUDIX domain-containing protein [Nocardia alni]|uniref:NUDIX domain-containing protein n=1 Tax=Nocardia alni TaxID=2815723 RepID=UPI001C249B7A|nr:NUDIX domain-containing protein [Nocardia alni]